MSSPLSPGAEYFVQEVVGSGQALVGHRVSLVEEVSPGRGRFRLVRVRLHETPWLILARLRRLEPEPCQCPRLPFPHRRTAECATESTK